MLVLNKDFKYHRIGLTAQLVINNFFTPSIKTDQNVRVLAERMYL